MKCLQVEKSSCEHGDEGHPWTDRKGQILEGTVQLHTPTLGGCTFLHYVGVPFLYFSHLKLET